MELTRVERALQWILPLIQSHGLTYHVSGGFSAHLFGANRAVNDIDLHLPHSDYLVLSELVRPHVLSGPQRVPDAVWDLWLTELCYFDQLIDLSSDLEPRVRHKFSGEWIRIDADFETDVTVQWRGLSLRVQNPRDVVAYKRLISFEGDEAKHLAGAEVAEQWARNSGLSI